MIHFNALDFNVCRSEQVMFLLTLSVFHEFFIVQIQSEHRLL